MGKGQRHSKNAGAMGMDHMTYNERRALGFGTMSERLGRGATLDFDCCNLTQAPVHDPVATPEGALFEREAILQNLLAQKKDIARRVKLWEAQEEEHRRLEAVQAREQEQHALEHFDRLNHGAVRAADSAPAPSATPGEEETHGASSATATQFEKDSQREMKAFWLPSKAPEAAHRLPKPPTDTVCPATGKRLRLKDLIPVKFTPLPDADRESTGRFMCCVSHDVLTNAQQCVLLRPTGDVMLESVYNRVVKPEGRYNGVKIRDKDVIKLRKGGTGFAAGGAQVESKKFYHLGHGSGLQEQRGEHRGPRSAFGLSIR
mmetsp:Transcript_5087/g.18521  ORF Transcript_5087/g.18521 Transcript_5087/m.18521 type:complete len:317 (+) Transcript_5087:189-1139(+)